MVKKKRAETSKKGVQGKEGQDGARCLKGDDSSLYIKRDTNRGRRDSNLIQHERTKTKTKTAASTWHARSVMYREVWPR